MRGISVCGTVTVGLGDSLTEHRAKVPLIRAWSDSVPPAPPKSRNL